MAVKTFTTGEVLTAADTNTYLGNAGYQYITSSSFSSQGTITYDGVFTSTYTNYLILGYVDGSAGNLVFQFRNTSNNTDANAEYYRTGWSNAWNGALAASNAGGQTSAFIGTSSSTSGSGLHFSIRVMSPRESKRTTWFAESNLTAAASAFNFAGTFAATTAFAGIIFSASTGSFTGNIQIYGARIA